MVDKVAKRLGYNYDTDTPERCLKNCAVMRYKIFLWGYYAYTQKMLQN